jgi:hypothetical protein
MQPENLRVPGLHKYIHLPTSLLSGIKPYTVYTVHDQIFFYSHYIFSSVDIFLYVHCVLNPYIPS